MRFGPGLAGVGLMAWGRGQRKLLRQQKRWARQLARYNASRGYTGRSRQSVLARTVRRRGRRGYPGHRRLGFRWRAPLRSRFGRRVQRIVALGKHLHWQHDVVANGLRPHTALNGNTKIGAFVAANTDVSSGPLFDISHWSATDPQKCRSKVYRLKIHLGMHGPGSATNPSRRVRVILGCVRRNVAEAGTDSDMYLCNTITDSVKDKTRPYLLKSTALTEDPAMSGTRIAKDAGLMFRCPGPTAALATGNLKIWFDRTFTLDYNYLVPSVAFTTTAGVSQVMPTRNPRGHVRKRLTLKFKQGLTLFRKQAVGNDNCWEDMEGNVPFFHVVDLSGANPGSAGSSADCLFSIYTDLFHRYVN